MPSNYDKSTRTSITNREKGNKAYAKKDFGAALIFYNKAISFAQNDSEDLSLAYGNRSAVYFELKRYDECLKNIRLAKKFGYPKDKKTLNERENKIKQLRAEGKEESHSDPSTFFKLSYDANSDIPFIIDRLQVQKNDKFGRGVYTLLDLNPGDVIAIEKPLISILHSSNDARYKHCCNCMKSNMMNLFPCTQTAGVMFCSDSCRDKTYSRVGNPLKMISDSNSIGGPRFLAAGIDAYGTAEKFYKFVENFEVTKSDKTIFDYDLKNPKSKDYKKNILNCILALNSNRIKNDPRNKDSNQGLVTFLNQMAAITDLNALGMQYLDVTTIGHSAPTLELHGSAVLAFGSLFNHSCDPNVIRIAVNDKVVFIVCKPVKARKQLFINYTGDFMNNSKVNDRRDNLYRYNFTCHCDACEFDYQRRKLIQPYNIPSPFLRSAPKSVEEAMKEIEENFKFIEDHGYNMMTLHNYERIQRNIDLLSFVAYHTAFPV